MLLWCTPTSAEHAKLQPPRVDRQSIERRETTARSGMVPRLQASRIHPRGSLCWLCRRAFLSRFKLSALFFSDHNIIPRHGVQVNRTMVIGPYDKRLKRSRCLNCIARHNKVGNTKLHRRSKRPSDIRLVFGRTAVLVLSESFTRLSICESDSFDHSNR
jgi:hypothetical protein